MFIIDIAFHIQRVGFLTSVICRVRLLSTKFLLLASQFSLQVFDTILSRDTFTVLARKGQVLTVALTKTSWTLIPLIQSNPYRSNARRYAGLGLHFTFFPGATSSWKRCEVVVRVLGPVWYHWVLKIKY